MKKKTIWQATEEWVQSIEERFSGVNEDDLTQIFMRGPFAGWSEYNLFKLAKELRDNTTKYPLYEID